MKKYHIEITKEAEETLRALGIEARVSQDGSAVIDGKTWQICYPFKDTLPEGDNGFVQIPASLLEKLQICEVDF